MPSKRPFSMMKTQNACISMMETQNACISIIMIGIVAWNAPAYAYDLNIR